MSFDPISQVYRFKTRHKVEIPLPLKQNKQVLSFKCRESGSQFKHGDSDVQGYHVCKDVWKPAIGKIHGG